ncbi:MAG: conserved hypothetical protein [Candidatus Desulfovibrio kirbyi]|uniref:Uncharacterized protein n=1 Tax=Candidatus Desulfovibrio kirbyi TaxID=2696086 RepID=A0A6L2R709_9BACT|nr:hypothetical protein [Desulfovibrio sp.]GFH63388.1 MAG: conserved hypothetical protein [Candidatus Desulfovibrio kirbyi]
MSTQNAMEQICLKHDNGNDLRFFGRLFSECSWFDEKYGIVTRQKLYITDHNEQVYYIIRSGGQEHNRHAYLLSVQGDNCIIYNGSSEIAIQFDLLMLAVRGLCGIQDGDPPTLSEVEHIVKAATA